MEKAYSDKRPSSKWFAKSLRRKYGPEALALMQKHEPEFFAINEKMMGAAMGAMMKKP